MTLDILDCIQSFNAGREPERLALKYRKMRDNPLAFLRGSCHLFQQRFPDLPFLRQAPPVWVCGDLHLENFGTFLAADGKLYFDINDFDESALAPCARDLVHLLTSILVARKTLDLESREARELGMRFLETCRETVLEGEILAMDDGRAKGVVAKLIEKLAKRSYRDFLDDRTELEDGKITMRLDGKKALPASQAQKSAIMTFMADFARQHVECAQFRVIDVARRIAGTGSLGIERYVLLVEGAGMSDQRFLLDLKRMRSSSLPVEVCQPSWSGEAHRVVAVQQQLRAASPAFLYPVDFNGKYFVLRMLHPGEDGVALEDCRKFKQLEALVDCMARVLASSYMRGSGWRGAATIPEVQTFFRNAFQPKDCLQAAEDVADQVLVDWKVFAQAFDEGFFCSV